MSARILAVVRLAEDDPELNELTPYLHDDDPAVRAAAVAALTETTPDGYEAALVAALHDPAREVSGAAANGLRELTDVVSLDEALVEQLQRPAPDPLAREVALATLRTVRRGTVAVCGAAWPIRWPTSGSRPSVAWSPSTPRTRSPPPSPIRPGKCGSRRHTGSAPSARRAA